MEEKIREVELWNRSLREEEKIAFKKYADQYGNKEMDQLKKTIEEAQAEIEKENENKKFTPTQEQLEMIEKILTDKSEKQQIENTSQEELTEDPEIKRLSYTRRNV